MKLIKVLTLVSAAFLMACNSTASTSNRASENTSSSAVESVTSTESTSSTETSFTSSETSTSSVESNSSTSSVEPVVDDNTLTFTFLNPACGSQGTDSLNEKLKEHMNTIAGKEFVTAIDNTACQFMADAPVKDSQTLTVGSAKKAGSLEFTFAETIKSITLTLETYSKTYTSGGVENTNLDSNSVLYLNTDLHEIDLKPVDGKAVTKDYTEAINAKSFKVYNKEANARVFIKALTVTY